MLVLKRTCSASVSIRGFLELEGVPVVRICKDYSSLGSILGSPCLGQYHM